MPALSPMKKESVELGGIGWVQRKIRLKKREDRVHGSAMKITETYCYSEIFLFDILINVKAGSVN
jgi:hypothetical protein